MSGAAPENPLAGSAAAERAPLPEPICRPAEQLPAGPVLLIAPHPDDDLLGVGCTASLHAARGDRVRVVIAYDGALGRPLDDPLPREEFVELREAEARAGAAHLGLEEYVFLRSPEGHMPGPDELLAAASGLAAMIDELRPGVLYAPWVGEHQLDHHVLSRVVRLAVRMAEHRTEAWGFEVWTPMIATRVVDISTRVAALVAGLGEHKSQIQHIDLIGFVEGMKRHRALYLHECGCTGADGGRPTHGDSLAPLGEPHPEDLALLEGWRAG